MKISNESEILWFFRISEPDETSIEVKNSPHEFDVFATFSPGGTRE